MHSVVYYRISDGKVVGSTTSQNEPNLEEELPHYGAGIAALRVDPSEADVRSGKLRKVTNGKLEHIDDADYLDKKEKLDKDKKSGVNKLKDIGLTEDEIKALIG